MRWASISDAHARIEAVVEAAGPVPKAQKVADGDSAVAKWAGQRRGLCNASRVFFWEDFIDAENVNSAFNLNPVVV